MQRKGLKRRPFPCTPSRLEPQDSVEPVGILINRGGAKCKYQGGAKSGCQTQMSVTGILQHHAADSRPQKPGGGASQGPAEGVSDPDPQDVCRVRTEASTDSEARTGQPGTVPCGQRFVSLGNAQNGRVDDPPLRLGNIGNAAQLTQLSLLVRGEHIHERRKPQTHVNYRRHPEKSY